MNFISLLEAMKARISWQVASAIFAGCEITKGRGWDQTFERLSNFYPTDEQLTLLYNSYIEHLLCGDKSVRYYKLASAQMNSMRTFLRNAKVGDSVFAEAYPFPLSEGDLESAPLSKHELVGVQDTGNGIAAIFSSVRISEVRVSLNSDNVSAAVREFLDGYNEVIVVKNNKLQAFDVLWVPNNGDTIEVRVDAPIGTPQEVSIYAQNALRSAIQNSLKLALGSPINLFPLIDRIYRAANEGVVVELAFTTDTASLKHEKMRRRNLCLRSEVYHVGGTAAVAGQIEPFKLGVQWAGTSGIKSFSPELTLFSTARDLHGPEPVLHDGAIRKCVGLDDYSLIQSKIATYLAAND